MKLCEGNNNLSGKIPRQIKKCKNLRVLLLGGNPQLDMINIPNSLKRFLSDNDVMIGTCAAIFPQSTDIQFSSSFNIVYILTWIWKHQDFLLGTILPQGSSGNNNND